MPGAYTDTARARTEGTPTRANTNACASSDSRRAAPPVPLKMNQATNVAVSATSGGRVNVSASQLSNANKSGNE